MINIIVKTNRYHRLRCSWIGILDGYSFSSLQDIINYMAIDIQKWENITGHRFNEMDPERMLTTLPSVYIVIAMDARP
jgi:hypothetical protein